MLGAISDEARRWRRHGQGETRIERWLYAHPEATPQHIPIRQKQLGLTGEKGFICHSLQEAAEFITQFRKIDEPIATGSFEGMYSCFDQHSPSPQLGESFVGSIGHHIGGKPPWYVVAMSRREFIGHKIYRSDTFGPWTDIRHGGNGIGNLIARRRQMTEKANEGMWRRYVVTVPSTLAHAMESAAEADLRSISYVIRRALVQA